MKKTINIKLIISIITGLFYISYMTYVVIVGNKGYIDAATGAYVRETYYLTNLDMLLTILATPCFIICTGAGISSIVDDFKKKKKKRSIITIIGLIILWVYNFYGIHLINKFFEPPKDAKEKAEKCEKTTECYKDDDIAFCFYGNEEIKCPIVLVEKKIKDIEDGQ